MGGAMMRRLVGGILLLVPTLALMSSPALGQHLTERAWAPLWLVVHINGIRHPETLVVLDKSGSAWVEREAAEAWRIDRADDVAPREYLGRAYLPLDELAGRGELRWHIDSAGQVLVLEASPEVFNATQLSGAQAGDRPSTPIAPGAVLNYDVSALTTGRTRISGLFDLDLFRGRWTATQSGALIDTAAAGMRRLETTLTADFPERRATLAIGDGIAHAGQWGRAVRFGGLQWATNFETQPDLITFPLPTVAGVAALPSTIDVFVNGALVSSREVSAGPFAMTDVPVVTGDGLVTTRVRDILGREHVTSSSFFASPDLLRPGLDAFSVEIGVLREHYGRASTDYGAGFAQGTWRRGLTASTTIEGRGELLAGAGKTLGLGVSQSVLRSGMLHVAVAGSRVDEAMRALAQVGFDYASGPFSLGAQATLADAGFVQVGEPDSERNRRLEAAVQSGFATSRWGSLSLAYVHRESGREARTRVASFTFARDLGGWGALTLTAARELGSGDPSIVASVSQSLGRNRSASYAGFTRAGERGARMEMRQGEASSGGLAYHVLAEGGASERTTAELGYHGQSGTLRAEIAYAEGSTGARATASGGIGLLGGEVFAMRHGTSSFALVEVAGATGVPVYLENQVVARTGDDGRAVVTGLRPYEARRIAIDVTDLPPQLSAAQTEVEAIPGGRGGVHVRFGVNKALLIRLQSDDIHAWPAGTRLSLGGQEQPVSRAGLVYFSAIGIGGTAIVSWRGGRCEAVIDATLAGQSTDAVDVPCRALPPVFAAEVQE